jgi:hypothetical protein
MTDKLESVFVTVLVKLVIYQICWGKLGRRLENNGNKKLPCSQEECGSNGWVPHAMLSSFHRQT